MRYSLRTLLLVVAMVGTFFSGFEVRRTIERRALREQATVAELELQKVRRSHDALQSKLEMFQACVELLQTQLQVVKDDIRATETAGHATTVEAKSPIRNGGAELRRHANNPADH